MQPTRIAKDDDGETGIPAVFPTRADGAGLLHPLAVRQYDCPQCAAPVPFETPGAVFAVCAQCRSMVVRSDIGLSEIGTMAELPPDHTPLQIGASGRYGNTSFKLLGRLRVRWDDGTWNEWYADFGSAGHGWVGESQGILYLTTETTAPPALDANSDAAPQQLLLGKEHFTKTDTKRVTVVAGEGELPFVAKPDQEWTSVDYTSKSRSFLTAEMDSGTIRFYQGWTCMPHDVEWSGLRAVPGWNGEPVPIERNRSSAIPCPACGGVIERRAAGDTLSLVCGHCGTLLDDDGIHATAVSKLKQAELLPTPALPLGTRGVLRGVEWMVIGALRRKTAYSTWEEILLYNPWRGYAWLTTWGGHWNFIQRLLETPDIAGRLPEDKVDFRKYSTEDTVVSQVAGEFYWRIRIGEKSCCTDYIAPPLLRSREEYPDLDEIAWSEGAYIEQYEIEKAFNAKASASPIGVFLNQPNPWIAKWKRLRTYAVIATLLLLIIQLISKGSSRQPIYSEQFSYQKPVSAEAMPEIVTRSFEIKQRTHPARVTIQAEVDNSWLGADVKLVDEGTGKSYPVSACAEYYHGHDDEGQWTEGNQRDTADIPAVPPGKYHLAINPDADANIQSSNYSVTLEHGGVFWSNFFVSLLVIWIWPAMAGIFSGRFEAKRWADSD